jgi:exonuclease III
MPIDRKSKCKNGTFIQPVASLKTFIKTNNLIDIWRKFNQDKQQFTWRRYLIVNIFINQIINQ